MNPTKTFIKQAQAFILDLLPRAGQILRSYFHSENLTKYQKDYQDFATAADLAADKFLRRAFTKAYPQIPLLTEETSGKNPDQFKNEKLLWIVDPLDGTANFSRGDSNFSISVALVSRSQPLLGAIFAPIASRLFWAKAYSQHSYWNGRSLRVSQTAKLNQAVLATDWSHLLPTRKLTTRFLNQVYPRIKQVKILGSAATDLTLLARGGVDIYHHVKLFPWDVAAAGLICQKAGAVVTEINGKPWNVFSPNILAANPILHQKISKLTLA